MSSATEIQNLALKLSKRSRLKLAGELLRSLAPDSTPDEILDEATRRESEIESGKAELLNESEFWSGIAHRQKRA
jgi:hypothetical protein